MEMSAIDELLSRILRRAELALARNEEHAPRAIAGKQHNVRFVYKQFSSVGTIS